MKITAAAGSSDEQTAPRVSLLAPHPSPIFYKLLARLAQRKLTISGVTSGLQRSASKLLVAALVEAQGCDYAKNGPLAT
jgi:hypothetical protein